MLVSAAIFAIALLLWRRDRDEVGMRIIIEKRFITVYLFFNYLNTKIMKKVQTKKLTLGKMTVANLNRRHMRFFYGGNDTQPAPPNPPAPNNPNGDILTYNESLVNEADACGTSKPKRTTV
jgi:hypothetical protein